MKMKNNSMMSVKAMIELYLRYNIDENTWDMLYQMRCHELISYENWKKFYETCKDWAFDESGDNVVDAEGNELYHYGEDGFLVKTK